MQRSTYYCGCALLLSLALGPAGPAAAQSDAERIFGAIVQELERQTSDNRRPRESYPQRGMWGYRHSSVPSGPTGSVTITNNSNRRVRIGFARPNGGGTSNSSVGPNGTFSKSGLALGTQVMLALPGPNQQFQLTGSALSLTIEPNGNVLASSSALPPDVHSVLPGNTYRLTVWNRSSQDAVAFRPVPGSDNVWAQPIPAGGQLVNTDFRVGSTVRIEAGNDQRSYRMPAGDLTVFIRRNGTISFNDDPQPPPQPVGADQIVTVRNQAPHRISLSLYPLPPGGRNPVAYVTSGDRWQATLRSDTRITLDGQNITPQTVTVPGGAPWMVTMQLNGRVQTGLDTFDPPNPPSPAPERRGRVEVVNRSGDTINVKFGGNLREVKHPSGYIYPLRAGKTVQIWGNGATAFFTYQGGNLVVRALPDGQYEDLPADAVVVSDSQEQQQDPGNLLLANMSSQPMTVTYQLPGQAPQSVTMSPGQQAPWVTATAGTQITATAGGASRQAAILPGQWTSLVLDAQNKFQLTSTAVQHTPPGLSPVKPPSPIDPSINPGSFVNPDPPKDDPLATEVPTNELPSPRAAPLSQGNINRFSQKTLAESKQVVETLIAGSADRIAALEAQLEEGGLAADAAKSLTDPARAGEPRGVTQATAGLADGERENHSDATSTLRTIASMRQHLLPLERKLSSGEGTSDLMPHLDALIEQASNLGIDGLRDAAKRVRNDLLIRDTVSRSLGSSGIEPQQLALPQGEVTVIRHPWITSTNTYYTPSGVMLQGTKGKQVQVLKAQASQVLRLPVATTGKPAPNLKGERPIANVRVVNPGATRTPLTFKINGKSYTLKPGKEQTFEPGSKYEIEFSSGSSGEFIRNDISEPGAYAFAAKDGSWTLQSLMNSVKLQNPSRDTVLVYLVDGEEQTLEPEATAVHTSPTPLALQFDAGEGTSIQNKLLAEDGNWYFAINSATGYWDLYPGTLSGDQFEPSQTVSVDRPSLSELRQKCGTELFKFSSGSGGNLFKELQ